MKDNYTATIYVNSYEGEYKQKSSDNLEVLLDWLNNKIKTTAFDMEIEVINNSENKIIEKRVCKVS